VSPKDITDDGDGPCALRELPKLSDLVAHWCLSWNAAIQLLEDTREITQRWLTSRAASAQITHKKRSHNDLVGADDEHLAEPL